MAEIEWITVVSVAIGIGSIAIGIATLILRIAQFLLQYLQYKQAKEKEAASNSLDG